MEVRARLAVAMLVAALLPVFAMDMVVLRADFTHVRGGFIEAAIIGTGVGAALLGLGLGWAMSGFVLRYAKQRVDDATARLVEVSRELEVQRNRLADAMDGSRLAMWELDMPSGMIHLSANWWSLMGATPRESSVPIAELIDRVPNDEQADCWSAVRAVMRGGTSFYDVEHRVRRDDGTMMWIRSRGSVSSRAADGRVLRMTGTNFDITARKVAQIALQESEAKLRLVADSLPLMVTYLDADLRFLFANREYLGSFGAALGEVLGRRLGEVAGEEAEELVRSRMEELRAGCTVTYERERQEAGGGTKHYEVRIVPRRDASDRLEGMFTVIQDITERAVTSRLFEQLALSDPLTSLPNKRLLLDRIERAIAQAGRRDGFSAVLFVDLDGFKTVNDSMGHTEGDRLLKAVASRLRSCARASDTVARFGGDEFVVLLEGCRTPTDAGNIARKMAVALSLPFPLSRGEAEISCSIGIALHPRDGLDPETLLAHADAAMYRAKQAGKNRVVLYAEAPA